MLCLYCYVMLDILFWDPFENEMAFGVNAGLFLPLFKTCGESNKALVLAGGDE